MWLMMSVKSLENIVSQIKTFVAQYDCALIDSASSERCDRRSERHESAERPLDSPNGGGLVRWEGQVSGWPRPLP